MTFSSLLGNERAKVFLNTLAESKEGPQVLLFSGPEGVGKKQFALEFAKLLLGKKHEKKIEQKIHPDVMHFFPEGKSHQHPISSIKKILEEAALPPFEASLKVYIVEEAEKMLPSSSNALLKVLEEPNSFCRFLLLTSRPDEILPTIHSRCCKVVFYPVAEKDIQEHLQVQKKLSFEKARQVAMKSDGSFSKAELQIQCLEDPVHLLFIEMLKHFFLQDSSLSFFESLGKFEKLLEKKEDGENPEATVQVMERLFEDLLFWLRDLHIAKQGSSTSFFHEGYSEILEKQAKKKIPSLEEALILVEKARLSLQRSFKPKVVLEQLFFALSKA